MDGIFKFIMTLTGLQWFVISMIAISIVLLLWRAVRRRNRPVYVSPPPGYTQRTYTPTGSVYPTDTGRIPVSRPNTGLAVGAAGAAGLAVGALGGSYYERRRREEEEERERRRRQSSDGMKSEIYDSEDYGGGYSPSKPDADVGSSGGGGHSSSSSDTSSSSSSSSSDSGGSDP